MGIKNYIKYLDQEHHQAKIRIYDYLYLDCNYIIHFLIYKCKSDLDLYRKIDIFWNNLISIIKIKKKLYLIYDGESENNKINDPKYQTHILRDKVKIKSNDYDKQTINPGSNILKTFHNYLEIIIEKYKKFNKLNFEIILDNDENKGEGDIKILNIIYNSDQDNICICSKDSDMILISHSLIINKLIDIDILVDLRSLNFIDKNKFKNYNLDYVLIVLLLGNDYLPKISNVNYNNLIDSYNKYLKYNDPLIINNNINYDNLIIFITYVILNSKKNKFNNKNININKFSIYYNNLCWCLKYYKILNNDYNYDQNISINYVINIYNFINFYPV